MMSNRVWRTVNTILLFVGIILVGNQELILQNTPDEWRVLLLLVILGFREYLKDMRTGGDDESGGDVA